jgi:hypothetical protein
MAGALRSAQNRSMKVSRPLFASPLLCIDDFLCEEDAQRVLRECIDLKKLYMPAKVFNGPDATKIDPRYRTNEVVYLDEVLRGDPGRSDILGIMEKNIWTEECRRLWHEGDPVFDIINSSTWHEAVISRYGNCGFYKKHRDTKWEHMTHRLVTLVYYVNRVPERFTGGALTLWKVDQSVKIEPKYNRAVIFPSFTLHEVENTRLNSDKWEDGRFSLNYWIGFR